MKLKSKEINISPRRLIEFAHKARWYHTIELRPGVKTFGTFEHAPYLKYYGFPDSLLGQKVLDVGASDGFFSFEFERRGASKILAIDLNRYDGSMAIDPSPSHEKVYLTKYTSSYEANTHYSDVYNKLGVPIGHQFLAVKKLLNSSVKYRNLDVYKLNSLDTKFDFVFCGDLIEHLKNPLLALENLVLVTRRMCIISLSGVPLGRFVFRKGYLNLIVRPINRILIDLAIKVDRAVEYTGNKTGGSFFHFYPEAFRQAILASGFRKAQIYSVFDLPNLKLGTFSRHAIFHCFP